jgi:hypothetical protein
MDSDLTVGLPVDVAFFVFVQYTYAMPVPDPSQTGPAREQPICDLATTCRSLFTTLIQKGSDSKDSALHHRLSLLFRPLNKQHSFTTLLDLCDDFEQFRVWAKNLGVFATDTSSLDYRLREAIDVRDGIVSLLRSLCGDLTPCMKQGSGL